MNWKVFKTVVVVGMICLVPIQFNLLAGKQNETEPGSDWPGFLGPNRDGKSAQSGILTDWSEGKLKIVWRTGLGKGYSNVATANGQVFLLDAVDRR